MAAGAGVSSRVLGDILCRGLADILTYKPNPEILHSTFQISAALVASAAYSSAGDNVFCNHFRAALSLPTAHCDSDSWDWRARARALEKNFWPKDKVYKVKLKPLLSAFYPKALLMAAVRALLLNYIAVLESYLQIEEDELEDEGESCSPRPVPDLIEPAKKSIWTAAREVTVVTTRRVLERVVVLHVAPRVAHKLTKDYYDSALRKAGRGVQGWELTSKVCATTYRCHELSILAQWIVQVSFDCYKAGNILYDRRSDWSWTEDKKGIVRQQVTIVVASAVNGAVKGFAALVGAAIGAWLGSNVWVGTGTWIGFVLGDLAGPNLVSLIFGGSVLKL